MKVGLATIGRYASALKGAFFTNVSKAIDKLRQFIASFFKARNSVNALPRAAVMLYPASSAHQTFAQKLTATAGSQTSNHRQTAATQTPFTNVTTVATQTEDTVEATIDSQSVVDDDDLSNQLAWDDSDLSNQLVQDDDDRSCDSIVDSLDELSKIIGKDIKQAEQQGAQDLQNLSALAEQAQSDIDNRADILERQIQDTDKQLSDLHQEMDKALEVLTQKFRNDTAEVDRLLNEMEIK